MKALWHKLLAWLKGKAAAPVTPAKPADPIPDTPAALDGVQSLWPAVECDWMIHGEGTGENEIRQRAIDEASAQGKAIRFRYRQTGTDMRFWVLWWESDVDKGKFPASHMWSPRALAAGVRRWVVEIPAGVDQAVAADAFKAYGDQDHCLQIVQPSEYLVTTLGLDANGVKTTPPRRR